MYYCTEVPTMCMPYTAPTVIPQTTIHYVMYTLPPLQFVYQYMMLIPVCFWHKNPISLLHVITLPHSVNWHMII